MTNQNPYVFLKCVVMVTEHWVFDSSYYWTECLWRQVNNERHSLVVRHSNYNSKHAGSNPADANSKLSPPSFGSVAVVSISIVMVNFSKRGVRVRIPSKLTRVPENAPRKSAFSGSCTMSSGELLKIIRVIRVRIPLTLTW